MILTPSPVAMPGQRRNVGPRILRVDAPGFRGLSHWPFCVNCSDGFGLPPLEAIQCGVPVITSNVSSLPEVVGDAANPQVTPLDLHAISAAMHRLYQDAAARSQFAAAGLARARQFSWENAPMPPRPPTGRCCKPELRHR